MTSPVTTPVTRRRTSDGGLAAGALLGAAVATFCYSLVVDALVDDGTFIAAAGYPGDLHDGVLRVCPWVLLVGAVVLGVVAWRRDDARLTWAVAGAVLFGAGVAWFAWSTLDMHALEVYDWPEGDSQVLPDLAYHGGASVLAAVGWIAMTWGRERPGDR